MTGFLSRFEDQIPEELRGLVELVDDSTLQVGGEGREYHVADLEASGSGDILGQEINFSAGFEGKIEIHPEGPVALFEEVDPLTRAQVWQETLLPGDGKTFIESQLDFGANAAIPKTSFGNGALRFSVGAAGGAEFTHRHLLAVDTAVTRGAAVEDLVRRTIWPQRLLKSQRPSVGVPEAHVFQRRLFFNLNVDANWGGDWDLDDLRGQTAGFLGDLDESIKLHVAATIAASLGWGLYHEFYIATGTFGVLNPGGLRVVMARARKSSLTLGATLALQVQYKLGKDLVESLVERAFDLVPGKELMKSLRKANQWLDEVEKQAKKDGLISDDGTWSAGAVDLLRGAISGQAKDDLQDFLDEEDLLGAADDVLLEGVRFAKDLVRRFDDLEPRLSSFWEDFLSRGDLGPGSELRTAIQSLADLDPQQGFGAVEQFLGDEKFRARLRLIEAFTGLDLDELAFHDNLEVVLRAIQSRASDARDLLDFIDSAPAALWRRFERFAERTGLQGTVDWLRENATSVEQLKSRANERIAAFVERALGKGLAAIGDDDLNRLRTWLETFDPRKLDALKARILEEVQKLEGDFSLNLGIEWERISSRSAVIDLEVQPDSPSLSSVSSAVAEGDIQELLKVFSENDIDDGKTAEDDLEGDTDRRPGLLLRESILTSSKFRSRRSFFSFLGLGSSGRTIKKRTTNRTRTLRIQQEGQEFVHDALLEAEVVRSFENEGERAAARSQTQGVRFSAMARIPLDEPSLDGGTMVAPRLGLDLSMSRRDMKTTDKEASGLLELLEELGFDVRDSEFLFEEGAEVRMNLELRLGHEAALEVLSAGGAREWNLDLRNAAARLFDDSLAKTHKPSKSFLWGFVQSKEFASVFASPQDFYNKYAGRNLKVTPKGREPERARNFVRKLPGPGGRFIIPQGKPIYRLIHMRKKSFVEQRDEVAPRLEEVQKSTSLDTWETLLKPIVRQLRRLHLGSWSTPNFGFWFMLARLARQGPEHLASIQGVATVQWRANKEEDWKRPIIARLEHGVPLPEPGTGFLAAEPP